MWSNIEWNGALSFPVPVAIFLLIQPKTVFNSSEAPYVEKTNLTPHYLSLLCTWFSCLCSSSSFLITCPYISFLRDLDPHSLQCQTALSLCTYVTFIFSQFPLPYLFPLHLLVSTCSNIRESKSLSNHVASFWIWWGWMCLSWLAFTMHMLTVWGCLPRE